MAQPLHVETPLWRSDPLSAAFGGEVWLKMDCFQPVGSFKIRGMGRMCQAAAERGARRVVSSSGGNAGMAIAYACRELGLPATVVVPRTTSEFMRERIRATTAEVLEHGEAWDDAHAAALEMASAEDVAYIHPFDDPLIWEGHASLIDEVAARGPKPGAVVVAVGGGGLLAGILEGLHRVGWADVPVVTVETEGAASFKATVDAGRLVTLPAIRSIATTLGARTVTPRLLEWNARHEIHPLTVTDRQAVDACMRFLDDHRVLVEPACGAALAACYESFDILGGRSPVLVEVCGGAGIHLQQLLRWNRELA